MTAKLPANKPEQDTALAENTRRPLVRAEVLAKHFDVHKRTVLLWSERNEIPSVKIGGARRFDMEAVLKAIHGKSHQPALHAAKETAVARHQGREVRHAGKESR